jgi:hypothetical protein
MFAGPPGPDTPLAVLEGLLWKRKYNIEVIRNCISFIYDYSGASAVF